MRTMLAAAFAALLIAPAFAVNPGDGADEAVTTTVSLDIYSAVTVAISEFSRTIVLEEIDVEGQLTQTAYATVTLSSNDEATLVITSTALAPVADGDADDPGAPVVAAGTNMSDVLNYDLKFVENTSAKWADGGLGDYDVAEMAAGIDVLPGADTITGDLTAKVWTGADWPGAYAGAYDADITVTLTSY